MYKKIFALLLFVFAGQEKILSMDKLSALEFELCNAILSENEEDVALYIDSAINDLKFFDVSFLWIAYQVGNKSIINFLKERNASLQDDDLVIDLLDKTRFLRIAAYFGKTDIVQKLFKKDPTLYISENLTKGDTALYFALCNEHYETARSILDAGVKIDKVSMLFLDLNPSAKLELQKK